MQRKSSQLTKWPKKKCREKKRAENSQKLKKSENKRVKKIKKMQKNDEKKALKRFQDATRHGPVFVCS